MIKFMQTKVLMRVPFDKNIIENFFTLSDFKKFGLLFKNKNILINSYKKVLGMTVKKLDLILHLQDGYEMIYLTLQVKF